MTTNLERWRYFTKDLESPDLYIDWTFYATISAALERRVAFERWPHEEIGRAIFCNLYTIFIGPPGVGKSTAAAWSLDLFRSFGGFKSLDDMHRRKINVAPSSTSLEGLYRYMSEHSKTITLPPDAPVEDSKQKHTLATPIAFFAVDELATLFHTNTDDIVNFLSQGFDCQDFHRQTKTQGVDFLKSMCVTLLGCATPDWIRTVSKNGLLKQGFAARTVFVWGGEKRHLCARPQYTPAQIAEFKRIREHIEKLLRVYGPMYPTPDAIKWLDEWYMKDGEKLPPGKDKILTDYYARKRVHLIKLAMLMHFADSVTLTVTVEDFERALRLLERTEVEMHIALLGQQSENPAARVASLIMQQMKKYQQNGDWVKEGILLHETFDDCLNGRATFDEAAKFLIDTGRLVAEARNGKICYRTSDNLVETKPTTH